MSGISFIQISQPPRPLPKLEQHSMSPTGVLPIHIQMLAANDAAAATLQTAISYQSDVAVALHLVAGCRTDEGAAFEHTDIGADIGVLDLDVRSTRIHPVAVLEQLFFNIHSDGVHRMAFQSL